MKKINNIDELIDGEIYYIQHTNEYDHEDENNSIYIGKWNSNMKWFDIYGPKLDFVEDSIVILYSEYLSFIKNNIK